MTEADLGSRIADENTHVKPVPDLRRTVIHKMRSQIKEYGKSGNFQKAAIVTKNLQSVEKGAGL